MTENPQSIADVKLRTTGSPNQSADRERSWLHARLFATLAASTAKPVAYSFADQGLASGASFLVNVVLARAQTKEDYGMFVLAYSVFTFFSGLYNATILEPYTVYGSGRYRDRFSEYLRLMTRSSVLVGLMLSGGLLLTCLLFVWLAPHLVSWALVGLGLTAAVLLSGPLLRRVFYLQRRPALAASASLVFFLTVACMLWVATKIRALSSFSAFIVLAAGWIAAGIVLGRRLPFGNPRHRFIELEPNYWREHWKYARWVVATAFLFQLTNQGYYWLVAGFLSVKEVAEIRAMYILVAPIEQVMISLSFLVLPVLAMYYATKNAGNFLSLWKRYGLTLVGVTGLFALAVRMLGRSVMHVLYAGKYDGVAPLLFMLAFVPLLMGVGNTMCDALKAIEKPKLVFYAFLCSGAATFVFGIPLIIHFGLRGAAYGMLLSAAAYTGALAVGFRLNVHNKAGTWEDLGATRGAFPLLSGAPGSEPGPNSRDEAPPPLARGKR